MRIGLDCLHRLFKSHLHLRDGRLPFDDGHAMAMCHPSLRKLISENVLDTVVDWIPHFIVEQFHELDEVMCSDMRMVDDILLPLCHFLPLSPLLRFFAVGIRSHWWLAAIPTWLCAGHFRNEPV